MPLLPLAMPLPPLSLLLPCQPPSLPERRRQRPRRRRARPRLTWCCGTGPCGDPSNSSRCERASERASNRVDEDGRDAPLMPSQKGHVQVVRELIAAGTDVNHVWPETGWAIQRCLSRPRMVTWKSSDCSSRLEPSRASSISMAAPPWTGPSSACSGKTAPVRRVTPTAARCCLLVLALRSRQGPNKPRAHPRPTSLSTLIQFCFCTLVYK